MSELVVVDAGRFATKTVLDGVRDWFPSVIGEYRDLHLGRTWTHQDMVVEFEGEKYYIGEVAKKESSGAATLMLDTKVTLDTKLLILTALARTLSDKSTAILVTSVPISSQNELEKLHLKKLLLGLHTITVNGETKTIHIPRVEVGIECAVAAWMLRKQKRGTYLVVDIGSRTVNFTTITNGQWVDRLSGTLPFGTETENISQTLFVRMVMAELSRRLKPIPPMVLMGGSAQNLLEHFHGYTQAVEVHHDPVYANAEAMYRFWKEELAHEAAKTVIEV
ncbi:ParM/StbA family protein (plasmid) [Alicyclobacillus acidoterrestris]|uniref:ParM/StbA family protein n=1 Tax=Alicyclobacillus acidoterrestris TaxID=1450 RepID=UPI003F53D261